MSTISVDKRIPLRQQALADLKAEYTELWDSWKVVESKAQPIAALAGVFMAGSFAYLGQLKGASGEELVTLVVIIGLLIGCVIFGLCAIWVADVTSPYLSSEGVDETEDMLEASADDAELALRHERMIQAAISRWTHACAKTREALDRKRWLLNKCLFMLMSAGGLCVPLVLLTMFGRDAN